MFLASAKVDLGESVSKGVDFAHGLGDLRESAVEMSERRLMLCLILSYIVYHITVRFRGRYGDFELAAICSCLPIGFYRWILVQEAHLC